MKLILILIFSMLTISCTGPAFMNGRTGAHYGDGKFINPYLDNAKEKSFGDVIKMHNDEERRDWEGTEHKVPLKQPDLELINSESPDPRITWIGHSSFLVQAGGKNILIDPVFAKRASPVSFAGPKRTHPPGLAEKDLPRIDLVLISHNHYDHLDKAFVKSMKNNTFWIVPLGLKEFLTGQGVNNDSIAELDWYEEFIYKGIKVTSTPAQHFSARSLWDRNETLWCGYSAEVEEFKFWYAGDTGYNDIQFKEIGQKHGPFDLAIIPIGAYKPRWFMKDMHTNPEEAVIIHKEVESKFSIACHWGTFQLSSEAIDEPVADLQTAMIVHNIPENEFITLAIGETLRIK